MTDEQDGLDELFRTVTRLQIAAFLSGCEEAEFRAVQEYCGLTQSNLSKNVATLDEAGYLEVRKGYVGKYPRTWLALSPKGGDALSRHLATMQRIADRAVERARGE